jgi:hypothetical protein
MSPAAVNETATNATCQWRVDVILRRFPVQEELQS